MATLDTAVVDTTAPSISVRVTPSDIWPPNHKFVEVTAAVTVSDACDDAASGRLVSITSSEPGESIGDGSRSPDIEDAAIGTDDRRFRLRAERAGPGDGRTYTVTYEARDASGNTARATAMVTVLKSRGMK